MGGDHQRDYSCWRRALSRWPSARRIALTRRVVEADIKAVCYCAKMHIDAADKHISGLRGPLIDFRFRADMRKPFVGKHPKISAAVAITLSLVLDYNNSVLL
jgi:hypothetical protein